jgi:carboxylesterase
MNQNIKLDDLCFMLKGKFIRKLSPHDKQLLQSIFIQNTGQKSALLLLHGFASSPAVFRKIIPSLSNYDAIYCPPLPGHASNLQDFAHCTAENWLQASQQAYLDLSQKYEKIDVMGLSLGGFLACHLSQSFAINRLYLLAPALALPPKLHKALLFAQILQYLGIKTIHNKAGNVRSEHAELTYCKLPIHAIIEALQLIINTPINLPKCPTDLFLGKHDQVVDSTKIADLCRNKNNINIHWLNNSAHILPLDNDFEIIINTILEPQKSVSLDFLNSKNPS